MNSEQFNDFRKSKFDFKSNYSFCEPRQFKDKDLLRAAKSFNRNVKDVKFLTQGSIYDVFYFVSGENKYVLRVTRDKNISYGLCVESHLIDFLWKVFPQLIKPLLVDVSFKKVPFAFQVLPFCPKNDGGFNLKLLNNINNIKLNGFGPLDDSLCGIFDSWKEYLLCDVPKHIDTCVKYNFINNQEVKDILYYFDNLIPGVKQGYVLHNDVSPDNVINGHLIDWDSAIVGDPLFEVASVCCFYPENKFGKIFKDYYYSKSRPDYLFWLYYLRIALSRTVVRSNRGLIKNSRSDRILLALRKLKEKL